MRPVCKCDRPPARRPLEPLRLSNDSDAADGGVGGPSSEQRLRCERAACRPHYLNDAADLRDWLKHRRAGPNCEAPVPPFTLGFQPSTLGFRPSTLDFRPYADDDDECLPRASRPAVRPGPRRSLAPRAKLLQDEMARALRGRSERSASFARKREALERTMRHVWLADRSVRLRRRVSAVKRDVEADMARLRRAEERPAPDDCSRESPAGSRSTDDTAASERKRDFVRRL